MSNLEVVDYGQAVRPEQPIKFNDKEYVLRRANAGPLSEFKEAQIAAVKFNPDGSKQLINSSNLPFKLLSVCLYEMPSNNPVQIHTLKTWPNEVVSDLFKRAKKLCRLDEETLLDVYTKIKTMFESGSPPVQLDVLVGWLKTQNTEAAEPLLDLLDFSSGEEQGKN